MNADASNTCSASTLTGRRASRSAIRSANGDRSVERAVEEIATSFRDARSKADLPIGEAGGVVGSRLDSSAVRQRTFEHAIAPVTNECELTSPSFHGVERDRANRPDLQQPTDRLVHIGRPVG